MRQRGLRRMIIDSGARFIGDCDTRWLDGPGAPLPGRGRAMLLLADLRFIDSRGIEWVAEAGKVVDGFSIPRLLWNPFTGTPFTGLGRRASVIHDVYCVTKSRCDHHTHRMFLEACIIDGMAEWRARTYYRMVDRFGPNWDTVEADHEAGRS